MNTTDYQKRSPLRIFFHYFRPHRRLFFLDLSCALVIALIDLAFPFVSRLAMYRMLPDKAFQTFFVVMAIVVMAFVLRSALYYVVCYWGHTFGIRVEADIRRDLFAHMQELSFGYFDQNRTGQLMSRLTNDLFELTELAHHGPEDLLISAVTIAGALAVMFSIQWRLALVVALLLPIAILVVMHCRRDMSQASRGVKQRTAAIQTDLESSLSGMRTAKAFANEAVEFDKFSRSNENFKTSKRLFHKAMAAFTGSLEFFMSAMNVVVIAVGGLLIMREQMNYQDLITFSLYVSTFLSPIRKLSNFAELFANGFAGLQRFVEVMRLEPELKDAPDAISLGRVRGDISLEDVNFSYPDDPQQVLHHISLHIQPGETVAVVGPSGGGKSTLCQLLPRFYDVSSGSVRIDGTDVRQVTQSSLRQNIGIVQQDVFLFADSVLENIRYGRPDASRREVEEAARRAEIYDDIMAMPQGFDTYVGERGTLLSGGQKQRIAIARIFLKDPAVLILDEATSALDSVTEAKIQGAFDQLAQGRTTLIIAHRLSTIRSAHRILVIDNGVAAECGSHEQLMAENGLYAQLYRTQNGEGLYG